MSLRILLLFIFIVISEVAAGFVEDNQNIFYGHFESTPISYQTFFNYDKFPTSHRNAFDFHPSKLNHNDDDAQSKNLFKSADYADKIAYEEEVENAHRVALTKRHNNTDAAYVEAYTEALKAQRKAGLAGTKQRYNSHLLQNRFIFNPEHSRSKLSAESKSNFQQSHHRYEDVGKVEYYLADDNNHDLRKSVEYNIVAPNYEFNVNGVVHRQP